MIQGCEQKIYDGIMDAVLDNYERAKQYSNFNQTFHRMYGGDA